MLAQGVRWFDDWYAIEEIASGAYAIGEPLYHQINWNYLIAGDERALLFDTGPGLRNIAPVVASLTSLPLTVLPSHLHYDHTGNLHRFSDLAMADLPVLRACVRDGIFHATDDLYRGFRENMVWTPVEISRWWPIGHRIGLGGRALELIHTPGHSPDSVSLYDAGQKILLAADFLYLGELYAQIPGASLSEYSRTAEILLDRLPDDVLILGAHGLADADGLHRAPRLGKADLQALAGMLSRVRAGLVEPEARSPETYRINDRLILLVGPEAYQC